MDIGRPRAGLKPFFSPHYVPQTRVLHHAAPPLHSRHREFPMQPPTSPARELDPALDRGAAAAPSSIPSPIHPITASETLGLTAHQHAQRSTAAHLPGGLAGALERYSNLFRRGQSNDPLLPITIPPIARTHTSSGPEGQTLKFTQRIPRLPSRAPAAGDPGADAAAAARSLRLAPSAPDALETESVLIPMIGRKRQRTYTLCVSSQVGCAMGCTFCQTAQMGLIRSLTPAEIVAQWFAATHLLNHPIANIVFMGMGEPLDNFDNVIQAIAVLTDHRGPAIPMSRISISTVGRIDGLRRLIDQVNQPGWHRLGLAISLNAPSDAIRSQIMPINRAMPLKDLREVLTGWPIYGGFKFCFEYVLIPGVNDQPEHARQLADFVRGRGEHAGQPRLAGLINLIPYNPRDNSPWPAPDEADVERFLTWLADAGVFAKRRRTKGRDTMAACGQLGNPQLRRRSIPSAGPAASAAPA